MKYDKIKVCGHRRSGTHYISALVSINILDSNKYGDIYEKHKTPGKLKIKDNPNTLFIYVGRDFEGVAKSLFKMRKRFGLSVKNYDEFLKSRYCDIFNKNQKNINVKVETLTNKKFVHKVGSGLKSIKMTPYEFGLFDKNRWEEAEKNNNNVLMVKYDDVINDFYGTMKLIADKAGSDNKTFVNIDKKVGGTPMEN